MPPRDIWDLNPIYSLDFFRAYEDVLHLIGFREDVEELMRVDIPVEVEEDGEEKDEEEEDEEEEEVMVYESGSDTDTDDEFSDWGDDLNDLPTMMEVSMG